MVIKFSFFKIVVCILLLLPAFDAVSKECENRPGAAILPYAIDSNGDIQVLLARDTRGFWSSFGGGAKYVLSVDEPIARCEKSEETAVRETWEESRFLLSRSFLIEALKTATTIPANPLDSDFVTFVIMIEEIELSPYYSTPVVLDSASAETDGVA